MTDTYVDTNTQTAEELNQLIAELKLQANSYMPSKEVQILGATLILFQILDGILTAYGVYFFGIAKEGNPLLQALMNHYGYLNALIIAKGVSIAIVIGLCHFSKYVDWLHIALKVMIFIYMFAAIIPWTIIHFSHIMA